MAVLPDRPSVDRLRRQARDLQRGVRGGSAAALDLVRRHHPHPDAALGDPAVFRLADAQVCVARGYGFPGWPDLIRVVRAVADLRRDPPTDEGSSVADRFCSLACLRYDERDAPPRWAAARVLLDELEQPPIAAAAAAARVDEVAAHLAVDPAAARATGGPQDWPPLLHLTYSRVLAAPGVVTDRDSEHAVLATADALLDAGADPNSGFLWLGLPTPFTALTGCFGGGEQGIRRQPPHPHGQALAERLLRAGADPHDQQALYNRMFTPDDSHLELLFAYGLADDDSAGPWRRRLGAALESTEGVWARQLAWAADHGFDDRLDLLARHGLSLDQPLVAGPFGDGRSARARRQVRGDLAQLSGDVDQLHDGHTLLHAAAWDGDLDQIQALLAAGASPTIRDRRFGGRPLDWAVHAFQTEAEALLREVTPEVVAPEATTGATTKEV
ncbi:MAG: hypothetical protein ACFCVF_16375 [Kineosporiaceae bacterium]